MKRVAITSVVFSLMAGCIGPGVRAFGPFPSSPLSQFLTGAPQVAPIGTPEPPVGNDQFLLTIENQDSGFRTEADDTAAIALTTTVQITNFRTGASIGTLTLQPCDLAYAVIDCLDRPIGVSAFFPDGTAQAVTMQASSRCFDRTYYINRRTVDVIPPDEDGDGQPDGEPVPMSDFRISEANTNPGCSGF